MSLDLSIFHDYDIRGRVPEQLDEEGVRAIAKAIVKVFGPDSLQIGRDMRVHSRAFQEAAINEFLKLGVNVVDLGLISTDMLYFAAGRYRENLAITISASHNPPEYNGMKIVKKGAVSVGKGSGIYKIRDEARKQSVSPTVVYGNLTERNVLFDWKSKVLSFVDRDRLKPLHIVVDAGNGMAGYFMVELEKELPLRFTRLFYDLDGTFPNHAPNPLEEKNLSALIGKVKEERASAGMAFDGDGDRVVFVDELGEVVSGTAVTAMLAESLVQKRPDSMVLYNAVLGRIVPEVVRKRGGVSERVRVGHSLIKEKMRELDALFAGEHSGHYYFRDFYYSDSAAVAALLVIELMSATAMPLSALAGRYGKYQRSGEINFEVKEKGAVIKKLRVAYEGMARSVDELDGLSVWFDDWWFNIRPSNTESFLRLNVEADNKKLLDQKLLEAISKLEKFGAKRRY